MGILYSSAIVGPDFEERSGAGIPLSSKRGHTCVGMGMFGGISLCNRRETQSF